MHLNLALPLRRAVFLLVLCTAATQPAGAQALLEDVTTLSKTTSTFEGGFKIASAGSYQVRLSDFAVPANLASVRLIVTHGLGVVASLNAPGTTTFNASVGRYEVHVIGSPDAAQSFGTFGVDVLSGDGLTTVAQFASAISLAVTLDPNQTLLQSVITVTETGTHQVVLADLGFPSALQNVVLNILGAGGFVTFSPGPPTAPGTYTFPATPGTYQLLVIGQAGAAAGAGLFSVRISSPSGATLYDQAHPVGSVKGPTVVTLPTSGTYTLLLRDFAAPEAFTTLSAVLMRGASVVTSLNTAGDAPFTTTAGTVNLFLQATPAAGPGSGTLGIEITSGATSVYSDARTVSAPGAAQPGFTYATDVTTAGAYHATLTDFQFPGAFMGLSLNLVQSGASLGSRTGAGSLDVNPLAGRLFVTVITRPQSATTNHLFGLQVAAAGGGDPLVDVTQGVGSLFDARSVDITQAGSYTVTLSDLEFPESFHGNLALMASRGPASLGTIFGANNVTFPATAGRYVLNFVAAPATEFGTYGVSVVAANVPQPTVSLTANPTTVRSGGTTTLTWSSTNASGCVASGAWTGNKGTSGSEPSVALTANSTFSLTCTGAGGSGSAQAVSVMISSSSGSGGGGALGLWPILCLGLLAGWKSRYAAVRARA
ncbi:MAG TPA: hypothetical protein VEZ88_06635 [Steroidobacteraceae bacterium]|nr:hypothetical protein [Steroidobacteraceae bacterium]